MPTAAELFWSKIPECKLNECWIWVQATPMWDWRLRRVRGAHFIAWELINGPIPEGSVLRHTCDNHGSHNSAPRCCNPTHMVIEKVRTTTERFWDMVNKDGPTVPYVGTPCWLWLGGKRGSNDYGQFALGHGRPTFAHRFSWTLAHPEGIPKDTLVLHHCDTPLCIRPEHLFLGTNADNSADRDAKHRTAAKLPDDVVRAIRLEAAQGSMLQEIADKYCVSDGYVSQIVSRKRRDLVK